jgi:uncharacterized damage-inducible protein DinB
MQKPETSPSPPDTRRILLLQELAQTPLKVKKVVANQPQETLYARPEAGVWSAHMVIAHLAHLEPHYLARLKRILEEQDPLLESLGPAQASPESQASLEKVLQAFHSGRDAILALLYSLQPEQWQRPARHPTSGATDLRHQVETLILHDHQHLGQLIDLQQRPAGDPLPAERSSSEEAPHAN